MNNYNEKQQEEEYWQKRAKNEYLYKNETFYTITPIPYYYDRRKIIVKKLCGLIDQYQFNKICDLGCGDGEYLKKIYRDDKTFYGVDISENMITLAKMRADKDTMNILYEVSENGIRCADQLDFVYSVALFAHVNDETMKALFKNIYEHITPGGVLCICEQVAPRECNGAEWKRRTFQSYINALEEAGFKRHTEFENFRIDFRFHRVVFERHLAKWFYKKYMKQYSSDMETARIECNKNKVFVFCSWLATKLSIMKTHKKQLEGWGYCFICVRK